MKRWRRIGLTAMAAVLATQASVANAACLTEPELKGVVRFVAPDLIAALADKCATALPTDAYLRRSGSTLVARYRPGSVTAWQDVKALIARVPEARMFAIFDEATARGMVGSLVKDGLAKEKIAAADCGIASDAFAALDPLPPENLLALIATLARFDKGRVDAKTGKRHQPIICPAASPR